MSHENKLPLDAYLLLDKNEVQAKFKELNRVSDLDGFEKQSLMFNVIIQDESIKSFIDDKLNRGVDLYGDDFKVAFKEIVQKELSKITMNEKSSFTFAGVYTDNGIVDKHKIYNVLQDHYLKYSKSLLLNLLDTIYEKENLVDPLKVMKEFKDRHRNIMIDIISSLFGVDEFVMCLYGEITSHNAFIEIISKRMGCEIEELSADENLDDDEKIIKFSNSLLTYLMNSIDEDDLEGHKSQTQKFYTKFKDDIINYLVIETEDENTFESESNENGRRGQSIGFGIECMRKENGTVKLKIHSDRNLSGRNMEVIKKIEQDTTEVLNVTLSAPLDNDTINMVKEFYHKEYSFDGIKLDGFHKTLWYSVVQDVLPIDIFKKLMGGLFFGVGGEFGESSSDVANFSFPSVHDN